MQNCFFLQSLKFSNQKTVEARNYLKIKIQVIIFFMVFSHYHFLTYITKTQPPAPKKNKYSVIHQPNNQPTKPTKQTNQKTMFKKS